MGEEEDEGHHKKGAIADVNGGAEAGLGAAASGICRAAKGPVCRL